MRLLLFIFKQLKVNYKIVTFCCLCSMIILTLKNNYVTTEKRNVDDKPCPDGFEVNNFGNNINSCVDANRYKDVPKEKLKNILMWNEAYGTKEFEIGFGRDPFYKYKCPDTRCYSTSDRGYLKNVGDFDAIVFHQRSFSHYDLPAIRKPHQRYIYWVMESAQYPCMDIKTLNGIFNWTMTYKGNSDFYRPYGMFRKIRDHPPEGEELDRYIREYGKQNRHLASMPRPRVNRSKGLKAAWFVSHCATVARREKYAKLLIKAGMDLDVYGGCSIKYGKNLQCSRDNETACYIMMESKYKFYLSFENSLCVDYVTEKYFNILSDYNVIPISYNGANMTAIAPPHSSINALDFKTPKALMTYLAELDEDDAKYAEYFWWKDFYVVRKETEDRVQTFCDVCARLNDPSNPPKVYKDMYKWWVKDSKCKRLSSNRIS